MRLFNFRHVAFGMKRPLEILIEHGLLGCGYLFRTLKPAEDGPDRELNRELKDGPERNLLRGSDGAMASLHNGFPWLETYSPIVEPYIRGAHSCYH
jgi:hypothetical protein